MATLNELMAALNAKSDSILANAAKLNTTADSMNQTLDGILGVQEVTPLDRDETESFTTTNVVDGPQTEVGLTGTGEPIMGTDIPAPQNFFSDTIDSVKDYLTSGGITGTIARGIGSLIPNQDPRQTALNNFYGNVSNGTIQSGLMAGYNPVSGGFLNTISGGRIGQPTNYGLQNAYQKRIDTIKNTLANKYKDGDYSATQLDERLKALQDAKIQESMMLDRVNRDTAYRDDIGDSYSGSYDVKDDTSYSDPFDLGGGE
tara:strand:- start:2193 stop:2969 length:777 start_codon:yes stop_codon:yes gene_type:complete